MNKRIFSKIYPVCVYTIFARGGKRPKNHTPHQHTTEYREFSKGGGERVEQLLVCVGATFALDTPKCNFCGISVSLTNDVVAGTSTIWAKLFRIPFGYLGLVYRWASATSRDGGRKCKYLHHSYHKVCWNIACLHQSFGKTG